MPVTRRKLKSLLFSFLFAANIHVCMLSAVAPHFHLPSVNAKFFYRPDANVHLFNVNETAEDKNNCA